ncbi:MAG: flavin reductase [Candidatus Woesearchaeota archaeon]|nr:MAG: flavin reductase [Candidatus Woesearchaeota archaeon]
MEEQIKKKVLRMISYGLYILTVKTVEKEEIAAGTINWLSQCSFKPPLVMVGVKKDSNTYRLLQESKHFTINILGKDQKNIAQAFFGPTKIENQKLNNYEYYITDSNGVVLKDCPSFFECDVKHIYDEGDHAVVIGEVVEAGLHREDEPLYMLTTGWFYGG